MNKKAAVLCLDAGQTGVRACIDIPKPDGGEERIDLPEKPGVKNSHPLIPQLIERTHDAFHMFSRYQNEPMNIGKDTTIGSICVGSSGLSKDCRAEDFLDGVSDMGISEVFLAHDSVTGYLAALGHERYGAVVSAGTGVVTRGVGPHLTKRVDGWGWMIGNAGAASWMGKLALEAAMRAYDGRGPQTRLTKVAEEHFGRLDKIYLKLYSDDQSTKHLGSMAEDVTRLAGEDAVAFEICSKASKELAISAYTALRKADVDKYADIAVSGRGSVFNSRFISDHFTMYIHSMVPHAAIIDPIGDPLSGARQLGYIEPDNPLHSLIAHAIK